jgi:hypothetical protein
VKKVIETGDKLRANDMVETDDNFEKRETVDVAVLTVKHPVLLVLFLHWE